MTPVRHTPAAVLAGSALLLAVSCARFAPPERRLDDVPLPDGFSLYGPHGESPDKWWEAFESEDLTRLVYEALAGNFTLEQAAARIRQAAAIAQQADAALRPSLGYSADASVTRRRVDTGQAVPPVVTATQRLNALNTLLGGGTLPPGAGAGGPLGPTANALRSASSRVQAAETLLEGEPSPVARTTTESYGAGLAANYELDLWGRLGASREAARLDYAASLEDLHAAMHSVAGQVVLTWLDLLQAEQILSVTRAQLESNETTLELVELRYRRGLANALDVYQQRQAVAQTRAALPPLEARRQTSRHELAVLLGRLPRSDLALRALDLPDPGPAPEQGLPADLLANRPDVRAAGLRLRAADWRVSAARADRLPAIRLSASASYGAADLDLLLDNWMATLAASITGPIFDGGRRRAEVERTRAVVEERLSAYRQAVVVAVQEVENALVREARQREYIDALETQLEAARASHREALSRYQSGLSDYLPVLSALTNAQALERGLVQARHELLVYRVQLHLALGGSWMEDERGMWKGSQ